MSDDSLDNAKSRKGVRFFLRNYIASNIDGLILHSRDVIEWHIENVSKNIKYLEVPIIHNEKCFRQKLECSIDKANEIIKEKNLEGKKIILFTGRLVEVKNIKTLLLSFSKLLSENCFLIIVGDGELDSNLKEYAKELNIADKVLFTGRKEHEELYAWFIISQIFVLPSISERFGVVVNEALLAGNKIACSNLVGAVSLINENNGNLFNPYDALELANLLEKMLNDQDTLPTKIEHLRNSKMPFAFEDKINRIIEKL